MRDNGFPGFIRIDEGYGLPGVGFVRGPCNTPRLSRTVDQLYGNLDCLAFANHFQIQGGRAIAVHNADVARYESPKIFDFTDILFQFVVLAQKLSSLNGCFTVVYTIKDKTNNSCYEERDQKSKHDDYRTDDKDYLLSSHEFM